MRLLEQFDVAVLHDGQPGRHLRLRPEQARLYQGWVLRRQVNLNQATN